MMITGYYDGAQVITMIVGYCDDDQIHLNQNINECFVTQLKKTCDSWYQFRLTIKIAISVFS